MQPGNGDDQTDLRQTCAQFLKRDVLASLPDGEDIGSSLFINPARAHVAALRLGSKVTSLAPLPCQRIAVDGATPNRTAAERQLIPSSTAAKSRERKSIDKA